MNIKKFLTRTFLVDRYGDGKPTIFKSGLIDIFTKSWTVVKQDVRIFYQLFLFVMQKSYFEIILRTKVNFVLIFWGPRQISLFTTPKKALDSLIVVLPALTWTVFNLNNFNCFDLKHHYVKYYVGKRKRKFS